MNTFDLPEPDWYERCRSDGHISPVKVNHRKPYQPPRVEADIAINTSFWYNATRKIPQEIKEWLDKQEERRVKCNTQLWYLGIRK